MFSLKLTMLVFSAVARVVVGVCRVVYITTYAITPLHVATHNCRNLLSNRTLFLVFPPPFPPLPAH